MTGCGAPLDVHCQTNTCLLIRASTAQALRLRTLGANRSTSNINQQRRRDLLTY